MAKAAPKRRPSTIAVHEAGHAVMAFLLRARVEKLVYDPGVSGRCEYRFPHKPCPYINAMITLAGHRAEVLWRSADIKRMPADDWRAAVRETNFSMFAMNLIGEVAAKALRAHKDIVMDVARVLEEKHLIRGAEFLRIVKPYIKSTGSARLVVPLKLRK